MLIPIELAKSMAGSLSRVMNASNYLIVALLVSPTIAASVFCSLTSRGSLLDASLHSTFGM